MSSPYINTKLYTTISLLPNQMNNDLYAHLKNNIIKRLENKCFRHYGYISKIYEILEKKGGMLDQENPKASAVFEIKFSCRLCIPLKNKYIVCQVDKTTQALTSVSNGPIKVILTHDRINVDNFITGRNGILIRQKTGVRLLARGDYVKIKIDSRKFNDRDNIIMCLGIIDSLATEDEIVQFQQDEYNVTSKFIDYDKYIKIEEMKNDMNLIGEDVGEGNDDNEEIG